MLFVPRSLPIGPLAVGYLSLLPAAVTFYSHADGSSGGTVFSGVCCLSVFPHDISKIDAARVTKRDTAMFHDESLKHVYFGAKCQRSRSRGSKKTSLCRSSDGSNIAAGCVRNVSYAGFSPLHEPCQ